MIRNLNRSSRRPAHCESIRSFLFAFAVTELGYSNPQTARHHEHWNEQCRAAFLLVMLG
jgi:hypothetical protein